MPGVRVARTYERRWLRPDLVAGIVLAAILVPQGMAYAELAGLPAGHRPLHDHRLPGRLRHLRSVAGARAGAGLVGLAADLRRHRAAAGRRRSGDGHRPRRDAGAAGRPDRDRPRARQARLRRRPALQRGPGRLHERPRHHHRRRPAAEAVRLLHRRRRLHRRGPGVLRRPRPDERDDAGRRRRLPRSCCSSCPGCHAQGAGRAGRRRRRHRRLGRLRPRRARREDGRARCPRACPRPRCRGRASATSARC